MGEFSVNGKELKFILVFGEDSGQLYRRFLCPRISDGQTVEYLSLYPH